MPAILQHLLFKVWHHVGHALDRMRLQSAHRVAVTDQEQRRLLHLGSGEEFGALPVAFKVAVPVQGAVKAFSSEGLAIDFEVFLRAPVR